MPYFFTDANGQKQGPIDDQQLKELAAQGTINPNTPMETDTGYKGTAGQVPGLFVSPPPSLSAQTVQVPPVVPSAQKDLFCTNCGSPVSEQAVACMSCGAKPIGHRKFCRQCAAPLNPEQVVCVKCGAAVKSANVFQSIGGGAGSEAKSKVVAGLLGILLGALGIHKFYLGSWGWGLLHVINILIVMPVSAALSVLLIGIPFLILSCVWAFIPFIEGIMYLVMSEEAFAEKYSPETQAPFRW